MAAQCGAALRCGPELVPAAQHLVVVAGQGGGDADVAHSGADVDVAARAERLEIRLDAFVLAQGLDECGDGHLHHRSHLFLQLGELGGREPLVEPGVVCFETEVRIPDEKIGEAVPREGGEPGVGMLEVALEGVDVGRLRRDDAPAENADALPLLHTARHCTEILSGKLHGEPSRNPHEEVVLSKRAVIILLSVILALAACRRRHENGDASGAPATQTIAPAQAEPAPTGTDAMTQTVDIEDSRSEEEGGALNNPQTAKVPGAKKAPAPKKPGT